jgi:hypothetical protein
MPNKMKTKYMMNENKKQIYYSANAYKTLHTKYTRQRKREQKIKEQLFKIKEAVYNLWKVLSQIK